MKLINVGLTGNIGSGKSFITTLLAQKGAAVIDADALAKQATSDPAVLNAIAKQLGDDLIKDNQLDRAATAERVFHDPKARQTLNNIIHPWVREQSKHLKTHYETLTPPPPAIIHDIPLLFESKLEGLFDVVVVVFAPLEVRVARVMARSGLSREAVLARDAAQLALDEKVARADVVIDNSGSLTDAQRQVDAFWQEHVLSRA